MIILYNSRWHLSILKHTTGSFAKRGGASFWICMYLECLKECIIHKKMFSSKEVLLDKLDEACYLDLDTKEHLAS